MSKLRAPIRQLLDERLPEADVQRIWRTLQGRSQRRRPPVWTWPLMAAAAVLLGLGGWLGARGTQAPEPLAILGADALTPSRVLDGDVATVWPLSDGSRIQLASSSRLHVIENSEHAFTMKLDSGRGEFDVKPGGPRRWKIESGDLSVEVVGTSFVVRRDAQGVGVDVRHGIVRVRSVRIVGGSRQLTAGERFVLPAQQQSATAPRPQLAREASSDEDGNGQLSAANDRLQPLASEQSAPHAADLGARGLPQSAANHHRPPAGKHHTVRGIVDTGRPPVAPTAHAPRVTKDVDPSALLQSADQARRTGRVADAEALLTRVRDGWPRTQHAALASLTLARMRIATAPEQAAQDLGDALAAELPQGLREDAMARLVEAQARAGRLDLARTAAAAYRRTFPGGRRTAEIERWAQLP